MEPHPFLRPSGLVFTFLAIVQATVWTALALAGAFLHNMSSPMALESPKGFVQKVAYEIYQIYFIGKKKAIVSDLQVTETAMFVYLVLYLILSAIWLGTASHQFYVLLHEKYDKVKKSFAICAPATLMVSALDFAFGCMMAIDLDEVFNEIFNVRSKGEETDWHYVDVIVVGLMMTLAFRGFVLWLVNVVSAIVMLTYVFRSINKENKPIDENFEPIRAFDEISDRRGSLYPEAVNDVESRPTLGFIDSRMVDMKDLQQPRRFSRPEQTDNISLQIPEDQSQNGGPRTPQSFHSSKLGSNSSLYHFPQWPQNPQQPEPNYAKIGRNGGRNRTNGLNKVQPPVVPNFEDNFRSRPEYNNDLY